MNKYIVLFAIPAAAIQEWMATVDEATRKQQTEEMMQAWKGWMEAHKDSIVDGGLPLGKTKRVTKNGVEDIRNDLNWCLTVTADSHEAAAQLFVDHPHIQNIPQAYAEVMDANMRGM